MPLGNVPRVPEKSHLDDMRTAIRGDFERLAERRGGQELMRPTREGSGVEGDADPQDSGPTQDEVELKEVEPEVVIDVEPAPGTTSAELDVAEPEPLSEASAEREPASEDAPRSWLARLLGL